MFWRNSVILVNIDGSGVRISKKGFFRNHGGFECQPKKVSSSHRWIRCFSEPTGLFYKSSKMARSMCHGQSQKRNRISCTLRDFSARFQNSGLVIKYTFTSCSLTTEWKPDYSLVVSSWLETFFLPNAPALFARVNITGWFTCFNISRLYVWPPWNCYLLLLLLLCGRIFFPLLFFVCAKHCCLFFS